MKTAKEMLSECGCRIEESEEQIFIEFTEDRYKSVVIHKNIGRIDVYDSNNEDFPATLSIKAFQAISKLLEEIGDYNDTSLRSKRSNTIVL